MTETAWTFLDADPDERARFPDLATTMRQAAELAAPPNRWREVRRTSAGGRTWYLKVFQRLQLKNAVRLRLTRPRVQDEAQREAAMAVALRRFGLETPRMVALGRAGDSSYLLCAAISGASLRACLDGARARPLLLAAARALGAAARQFSLPDASADHVFVLGSTDDAAPRFALLDLHNASIGRARNKTLRRLLRHAARSLHDLPLRRSLALRAAVTLLRARGTSRAGRRRIVQAQPPWRTHDRYDLAGRSSAYGSRDAARSRGELLLLGRLWPGAPGETVLDSPCGNGRLFAFLAARTHAVVGSDRSKAMLTTAAGREPARLLAADALRLPLRARSVGGVVVFRFLHHLDARAAKRVVGEAARVADRWLVLTVFHPWSAHGLWRRLRTGLARRPTTRFGLSPRRVTGWLAEWGFEPLHAGRPGPLRELCVLTFRRRGSAS